MANKDYVKRLDKAILHLHGAVSQWVETVPVHEVFKGKTLWRGKVEVFTITGHQKAKRCYAWSYTEGRKNETEQFVAVLEIPPVTSPETAVKVAIGHAVKEARSIRN